MSTRPSMLNGPGSLDPHGQLRDRDGNSLASFPIYPGGLGGPEDRRNGELCALLPDLIAALSRVVNRCDQTPEGLRDNLLIEVKAVLLRIMLLEEII